MNDELAELKGRLRNVEAVLARERGPGLAERVRLAQAVSRARRLVRREDRTRAPSAEFRSSVEDAESLVPQR